MNNIQDLSQAQFEALQAEFGSAPVHTCDDLFDFIFRNLVDALTEEEMDAVLPVEAIYSYETILDLVAVAHNWEKFVGQRLEAIRWFRNLVMNYKIENSTDDDNSTTFAHDLFASLTLEQKAIVQQGYDILNFNEYPPLLDGSFYVIDLEENDEMISEFDFPIRLRSALKWDKHLNMH